MQDRLIAFGCSLTYGHGLPDCLEADNSPGKKSSEHAWPQLLANSLERQCINTSVCGSSNKRIWHRIVNFEFRETDLVFVLWSMPDRTAIVKSKEDVVDIGPWMIEQSLIARHYYSNIHDNYNSKLETALYINHSNLILEKQKIKVFHLISSKWAIGCFNLNQLATEFVPLHILDPRYNADINEQRFTSHPGISGHELFFKDLFNFLNIK